MADSASTPPAAPSAATALGGATYEVIRQRLGTHAEALRERMAKLDARRGEVFGSIEFKLLQADRVTTAHNCIPQDMVQLGSGQFLFGFNVQFGLKKDIELADVFAIYARDDAAGIWREAPLDALQDKHFITDFKRLYQVYSRASFHKFSLVEGHLYMVFRTGTGGSDLAVFKWLYNDGRLRYVDGRSEAEFRKVGFPPPHSFRWRTPDRQSFRYGDHPHVSIADRVFVETIEGDLTIKVEDNTATGEGIYSEPVEDKFQKVDDAEITYAELGHLILLKVRPYKEANARYFIFNEKTQTADRVDSIGQSCALLPEEHGLIFPDGYYLGTGELKRFETHEEPMTLERVIHSANGEDSLYVFFKPETGHYALMPYRLIAQKVEERITCNGFSLFPNGHLVVFRAEAEPQRHHSIQLRQTPFYQAGFEPPGKRDAFLYQVGNKEVVRCLAECNEVLTLARKENPYAELYSDLVKRCDAMLDTYPWLTHAECFALDAALREVRAAADQAVAEFDKVRRLQREAVQRVKEMKARCEERFNMVRRASFRVLNDFVANLAALRQLRGELITLKEVRYVDLPVIEATEAAVTTQTEELSRACVKFLLQPAALEPYRKQADEQLAGVEKVAKAAEGRQVEQAVAKAGAELEMLIEIVNNLKIEDATETTRIIDGITAVYSTLNQVKAALKKRLQELVAVEGAAQFSSKLKLLSQSAASYLDLCDTPAKCDEYLNRLTVQIEELEGAFADFEEYTVQLAEKRTSLYEAFEQRKVALVEQRNRRAAALLTAAERILKVIQNRLAGMDSVEAIHTYMASDLMIAKVREHVAQLLALGDSVKADDLQGRLKSVQQEAVRQLKDRQELFTGGPNVITLGRHQFNTNTQPLELTVVNRDGVQHVHLTSTKYFEPVTDEAFLATKDVWDQEVISENAQVYRAEFLAWQLLKACGAPVSDPARTDGNAGSETGAPSIAGIVAMSDESRLAAVQHFMQSRYAEGYMKGIHDLDAARVFHTLVTTHTSLRLARYHPTVRACAVVWWLRFCPPDTRTLWTAKLKGFGARSRLFPGDPTQQVYITALQALLAVFIEETKLFAPELAAPAGEYLFHELTTGDTFASSHEAEQLTSALRQHLVVKGCEDDFAQARQALAAHPASEFELVRDWVRGFLLGQGGLTYLDEVAAILFCDATLSRAMVSASTTATLEGMKGAHGTVRESRYRFDYLAFTDKLRRFEREVVPRFEQFHRLKQELLDRERAKLRLDEFKPKVLTSFVRNQLIDQVYLPLVGDNLAKQVGAAGAAKRTDLMGMLLLISPPGYGKTTLMEYVASRLGIVFVKINGPALGHNVTSLDPQEAPNAAAREEIQKLNLALEMGDNVMICVDDIQHTNPEFLQKFISLCDGQRRIEGVWRNKPRTYDLRGRKVVVVMCGNPYTESGLKFKLPDMLSNRADTYNLGDIAAGGNADSFKASYLENAVTSNPVLAPLANRSQKDVRTFIRLAATGAGQIEGETFEGSYSAQEVEEILSVMRKLVTIRDVVLRVNQEYIASAAQADEFRTEPAFRLQGSYRNMNRLAEKVAPIMNDAEIRALVLAHYRNESQTLTTGAEANMLKLKELLDAQSPEEKARWEEIKRTFKRNQFTRGADTSDPVGRLVAQLATFQGGLESIRDTLDQRLSAAAKPEEKSTVEADVLAKTIEALRASLENRNAAPAASGTDMTVVVKQFTDGMKALRVELSRALRTAHSGQLAQKVDSLTHELEQIHCTMSSVEDLARQQRDQLQGAKDLLAARAKQGTLEVEVTQEMLENQSIFLRKFNEALVAAKQPQAPKPPPIPGETE
ncbi:MAG: hypothetical protein FD161_3726 [Limisphaerales bacterium]|nr:MAG: hypothetical protein FD161_3726 [Limisphaerales bacterium]KAG0507532.1 MAG: hypothetical protein E1N63_3323 [Limisphaerales bacterium]TXT48968.1 MAG: hypothetical protein FD140_3350 [Limisphaerales bacterium]